MNILLVTPKLKLAGGVSAYWNSVIPILNTYKDIKLSVLEVGGHGKNIVGPFIDQWNFFKKANINIDFVFLNPSLGSKSFFRDALFAKQLIKKGIPFVVFFHGWDLDFEKTVDDKYIAFFLNTFGQAKIIFVLSEDFKNKILDWGYAGEIIIETTNVDSELINDFSLEEKLQSIPIVTTRKILFLARLIREKGLFDIVDAFETISKKINNIELIIAGDGEAFEKLKQRVSQNSNIIVTGHVDGQDKINLFRNCYIYCMPSYSEGLPISILEAMAFGLPVITTNVGGLKEFFKDIQMGYVVKVQNIEDLAEKLIMLLSDEKRVREISKFNYDYAQKHLLNTVVTQRIYKHLKRTFE